MISVLRFIAAYILSAVFLAAMLSVTKFWPELMGRAEWASETIFSQSVVAIAFMLVVIGLILTPFLGIFARIRNITSPTYYAFCWVVAVFGLILVTPGLQSVEDQASGFWVPFYGVIFAMMTGILFWFIAIRPLSKENASMAAAN